MKQNSGIYLIILNMFPNRISSSEISIAIGRPKAQVEYLLVSNGSG